MMLIFWHLAQTNPETMYKYIEVTVCTEFGANKMSLVSCLIHFRCYALVGSHCLMLYACLSATLTRIQRFYFVSGKQQFASADSKRAAFQSHHITHYQGWFAKAPQQPPATQCSCHLQITNCSFWCEPLHRSQEPKGFGRSRHQT